ncbi:MAG: NRDE family protein [Planctomycetes bacterium]|nr:NRDE family protein [Planctomycetota bacterium]
MCLLILLRGLHPDHPIVVAGNRDERADRKAAPPGLWLGARHRMLSPRDREAGGTWLAIDDLGRFAGITNVAGEPPVAGAPSRGHLPHLALDEPDLEAMEAAVRRRVAEAAHAAFQLVLCDAERTVVLRHVRGELRAIPWPDPVLVVSNAHAPGGLELTRLRPVLAEPCAVERRLDLLAPLLRDPGGAGGHQALQRGAGCGTVSSSLLAVPRGDPTRLVWRYAAGPPDKAPYRSYGNLGARLLPEA